MGQGPLTAVAKFHRREIYSMEIDIVLAHELVEFDVLRSKPPLFPLWCKIGRYTWVSDRGIELRVNQGTENWQEAMRRHTQTSFATS